MSFLKILLIILVIVAVGGIGYYVIVINRFKQFLKFEASVKANPSDEGVKEYMERYDHTYIPKQPHILESRSYFYRAIKASDKVSYEVKKELRQFFEAKEISTLTKMKTEEEDVTEED